LGVSADRVGFSAERFGGSLGTGVGLQRGRGFVSPRTVESHLTHVYTELSLTSRVQLAQEAARHA